MTYPYFEGVLPYFYRSMNGRILHGLKIWPNDSPLAGVARIMWNESRQKALTS